VQSAPDSGATSIGRVRTLEFTFSEKMDRVSAVSWLHLYPAQRISGTKWHGALRAEVTFDEPLPADTLLIVEIMGGMKDAHRVANRRGRRFPIATGDSIAAGRIGGVLVLGDSAVANGVVELWDVPPDTLKYFQQSLVRRAVTDRTGAYSFDWLPVPGGPWLLRAFADQSGDLRPGPREPQRLLPDTLSLSVLAPQSLAGVTTLYPPDAPGRLHLAAVAAAPGPGRLVAWTMRLSEEDTGWVPVPEAGKGRNFTWLHPAAGDTVQDVQPGTNRLAVFVDIDGDSTFSGVPVERLGDLLDMVADSLRTADADSAITHYLEPWFVVEGIEVLPGLATEVVMPAAEYHLTAWTPPPVAAPDTTGLPAGGPE
jgi:hypothetical protein